VNQAERWLEAVTDVAQVAGDVALRHFGRPIEVEWKVDGSPVTVADRAAEQAARDWIARRFPDHAVAGEEMGETAGTASYRWLIDPIDGTKSFVAGAPLWGTLVALLEGDTVLAGAVHCAAAGQLIAAAVGEGAWCNGVRARVSATAAVEAATLLTTDERFPDRPDRREAWRALASRVRVVRTWGDCFGYLLVATGRADAMVDDKMNPWDAAALVPVIEEAGGVFTDWQGRVTPFGGDSIATNDLLAGPVRSALGVPA